MIKGMFGASSLTYLLRGGLEEVSATHRAIARRVAGTLESSSSVSFSENLAAQSAQKKLEAADLQRDMAALADTQLRFEADAKLLQGSYAMLRTAIDRRA